MAAAPDLFSPEHARPPPLMHTPGPLSLSQLDTSHSTTRGGKLEPLQLPKERRPKRKTKTKARGHQDKAESTVDKDNVHEHVQVSSERASPPNEDSLASIRARLDPFYQSHAAPSLEPEIVQPTVAETGIEPAVEPVKKKKRRRKKEADEEAPLQEGGTAVAMHPDTDVDPPAPHTAPMLRDDPQADGQSSPTVSEGIVAGSEPIASARPKKRKKRKPVPAQPDPEAVESQPSPPPVVSSPSPPPQDVHVGAGTTPVQFEAPPEMELRQGAVPSYTLNSEPSLGESYSRPQTESPLVSGSRTPQVLHRSVDSPTEDAPHEQETASRWPVPPEDVIERTSVQEPVSTTAALFISRGGETREQNTLEGQSRDVVYLERRDGKGFIAQKKRTESMGTSRETDLEAASTYRNVISSALVSQGTHIGIQRMCLALLGLLAGLSLLDVVMVYVLSQQSLGQAGLLQFYSPVSLPLLSVYVILFLLVFVSVLDRIDPSHWSKECLGLYCQSPKQLLMTAAIVLLFLAMVVTFSVAFIYERISLYPQYPNLWLDLLAESNATVAVAPSLVTHTVDSTVYSFSGHSSVLVTTWQALAVIRAVCCVAAWLVIACLNDYDRLGDYLREKEEEGRKCTQ